MNDKLGGGLFRAADIAQDHKLYKASENVELFDAIISKRRQEEAQRRATEEATWGNEDSGAIGDVAARKAADLTVGAARTAGHLASLAANSAAADIAMRIPDGVAEAYKAEMAGTATDEQKALLDAGDQRAEDIFFDPTAPAPLQMAPKFTNRELVQSFLSANGTAGKVMEWFEEPVEGIQDQRAKNKLMGDLKDTYDNNDGAVNVFVRGLGDLANNPAGLATFVTENLPQLGMGAVSPSLMALSNAGYAGETFRAGIEAHMEEHGGLPDTETMRSMLMWSAAAGAAEQAGEMLQVSSLLKAGKAMGMTAEQAAKIADKAQTMGGRVGQAMKETLTNFVVEGGTEAFQTTVENSLSQGKDAEFGADEFAGGMIGAGSGGVIGGGASTVSHASQAAKGRKLEGDNAVAARQERIQRQGEAVAAGDIERYTNPESPDYDAATAVNVTQTRHEVLAAKGEARTAEETQEMSDRFNEMAQMAQDRFAKVQELHDPSKPAKDQSQESVDAFKQFTQLDEYLKANGPMQAEANKSLDVALDETAEVETRTQSAEQTVEAVASGTAGLPLESLESLARSGVLSAASQEKLENHIHVTKAMEEVGGEVIFGDPKKNQLGAESYRRMISQAVAQGDTAQADQLMGWLDNFVASQQGKAEALETVAPIIHKQVKPQDATPAQQEAMNYLQVNHGYKVSPGRGRGMPKRVRDEADVLSMVQEEMVALRTPAPIRDREDGGELNNEMDKVDESGTPEVQPSDETSAGTDEVSTTATEEKALSDEQDQAITEDPETQEIEQKAPEKPVEATEQKEAQPDPVVEETAPAVEETPDTPVKRRKDGTGLYDANKLSDPVVSKLKKAGNKGVQAMDLLTDVMNESSDTYIKAATNMLSKFLENQDIKVYFQEGYRDKDGNTLRGQYNVGQRGEAWSNQITKKGNIVLSEIGLDQETLIHEMLHAATLQALNHYDDLTAEQQEAVDEMKALADHFIKEAKKTDLYKQGGQHQFVVDYLENVGDGIEFASLLFTSKEFQELAEQIPTTGGYQNLYARFVNLVRRILGGTQTFLDEAMQANIRVMEANRALVNDKTGWNVAYLSKLKDDSWNWIGKYFKPQRQFNNVINQIPGWLRRTVTAEELENVYGSPLNEQQHRIFKDMKGFANGYGKAFTKIWKKAGSDIQARQDMAQFLLSDSPTAIAGLDDSMHGALVGAIYQFMAFDAKHHNQNDKAGINRAMGRDEKHPVAKDEYEALANGGVPNRMLVQSLGKTAYQALGLRSDQPDVEQRLIISLGNWAVGTMLEMGLVEMKTIELPSTDSRKAFRADNLLVKDFNTAERIGELNKESGSFLAKLFATDSRKTAPHDKPIETVQKTRKNSPMTLSPKEKAAIKKSQAQGWTMNESLVQVWDALPVEVQQAISGIKSEAEMAKMHEVDRVAQEAKNAALQQELDHYNDFVGGRTDQRAPFYFARSVWKMGRIGIDSNTVNPQNSKIHRWLMKPEGITSRVNPKNTRHVRRFRLMAAQGLGIKIDKLSDRQILKEYKAMTAEGPVREGINALIALERNGKMTSEEQAALVKAIKEGGEKVHTLDVLHEIARFETATGPYNSRLTYEIDGVTNGPAIGTLQFWGANPKDGDNGWTDMWNKLRRFGVYARGEYEGAPAFFGSKKDKDSYEAIAEVWARALNELLAKKNRKLEGLLGAWDLIEDGKVSLGRSMAKGPLMTTIYGAGLTGISEKVMESFYEDLRGKMAKIAAMEGEAQTKALAELNKQLGMIASRNGQPTTIKADQLLTFDPEQNAQFAREVKNLLVGFPTDSGFQRGAVAEALETSINENHGALIERRKASNEAAAYMTELYKRMFEAELALAREVKMQDDENVRVTKKGERVLVVDLSRKELNEIHAKLREAFPAIGTPLSESIEDQLGVTKFATEDTTDEQYRGETIYSKKPGNSTRKSSVVYGGMKKVSDPGVAPVVTGVQNRDATNMMLNMLEDFAMQDVHDAIIVGFDDLYTAAKAANKNFVKAAVEGESIHSQMLKSLLRAQEFAGEHHADILSDMESFIVNKMAPEEEQRSVEEVITLMQADEQFLLDRQSELLGQDDLHWNQFGINDGSHVTNKPKASAGLPFFETGQEEAKSLFGQTKETGHQGANSMANSQGQNQSADTLRTVDEMSASDLVEELNRTSSKQEPEHHLAHLKDVATQVASVLGEMRIKFRDSDIISKGYLDGTDINILRQVQGYTAGQSEILGADNRMSDSEVMAHQMVYRLAQQMLTDSTSPEYAEASKLWAAARAVVKVEDLMVNVDEQPGDPIYDAEYEVAQDMWNKLFAPGAHATQTTTDPKTGLVHRHYSTDHLPSFMAFAMTNQRFMAALQKKVAPEKVTFAMVQDQDNLMDQIAKFVSFIVDNALGLIKVFGSDKRGDVRATRVFQELVAVESAAKQRVFKTMGLLWDMPASAITKVSAAVKQGLVKMVDTKVAKKAKNFTGSGIVGAGKVLLGKNSGKAIDISLEAVANAQDGRRGWLMSLATEIRGVHEKNAPLHALRRAAGKKIDQDRKHIQMQVWHSIRDRFGRTLTAEERADLADVVLRGDLSALLGSYSASDLQKMLNDKRSLNPEIAKVRAEIMQKFPTQASWLISGANGLAHYMIFETGTELVTHTNAAAIAAMIGTSKRRLDPTREQEAKELVDKLASLVAIRKQPKQSRQRAAALFAEENARTDGVNGFMELLEIHSDFKAEALARNFDGQEFLVQKGYMKEIGDPSVEIIQAPVSEKQNLMAQGYIPIGKPLQRDPSDRVRTPMQLYKHPNGGLETWNTGIVSNMHHRHKGQDLLSIRKAGTGIASLRDLRTDKAHMLNQFTARANGQYSGTVVKDVAKKNLMLPVLDGKGNITSFRYTMSAKTKDAHLGRRKDIFEVFSSMAADVVVKEASKTHNVLTIKALKAEYDKYKDDPTDMRKWVAVGPRVGDKERKEAYHLLPREAKEEIRKVWGGDTMYVPAEEMDLIFGYRSLSVNQIWKKNEEDLKWYQHIVKFLFEKVFGAKAAMRARQTEDTLKTLAQVAKDTIVVKSGIVLLGNMVSNVFVMKAAGISWRNIFKAHKDAISGVRKYQVDGRELQKLEHTLSARKTLSAGAKQKLISDIAVIKDRMSKNPVADLVEEGLLPTIVDDVTIDEDGFTMKNDWDAAFDKYTAKLPKPLEKTIRTMAVTHDTKLYQGLSYMTQVSDFIGRYAMYHHLTKEDGLTREDAINQSMQTFINYDLPTHPVLQYANDLGILIFTKYFLRTQAVILQQMRDNPGGVLLIHMLDALVGGVTYIGDSFFLFGGLMNRMTNPIELTMAAGETMPVKLADTVLDL